MLKRLGFGIEKKDCEDISNTKPGAIERLMKLLKFKLGKFQEKHGMAGGTGDWGPGSSAPSPAPGQQQVGQQGQQQQQQQQQQRGGQQQGQQQQQQQQPVFVPPLQQQQQNTPANAAAAAAAAAAANAGPLKSALKGASQIPTQQHAPHHHPSAVSAPSAPAAANAAPAGEVAQKNAIIGELKETNDILETKCRKLEQLVRLKDAKIQTLLNKLQAMGVN